MATAFWWINRAIELGYTVSVPTTPARYDPVLEREGVFLRVQVKYGGGNAQHSQGACRINFNCWAASGSDGGKRSRTYGSGEIDLMLAYLPATDEIIELPEELYVNRQSVYVRFTPSRNGQTHGINLVSELIW